MRSSILTRVVLVSAIGYLVDIYDLVLFGIVRMTSLKDLGYAGEDLFSKGILLVNTQLFGLLLGGILWGVLGDRIGRVIPLFGSILLFSVANFANGFVHSIEPYLICRFLAGVGLAGELGIGVTLTAESLPAELRTYGVSMIAGIGMLGAILASGVSETLSWRYAYLIGGILGLILLFFRKNISEPELYLQARETARNSVRKRVIPKFKTQFIKYVQCVALGLPTQFITGILFVFSPELMTSRGLNGSALIFRIFAFGYTGAAMGNILGGVLSQSTQTRKYVALGFLLFTLAMTLLYILAPFQSELPLLLLCALLGMGCGFWTIGLLITAELFGTNQRATAATSIPNLTRATLVLLTLSFARLRESSGISTAALIIGMIVIGGALLATLTLKETYGKSLNFDES